MDNENNNLKKCGFCGMEVSVGAGRCPYCGSLLEMKVGGDTFAGPQESRVPAPERETPSQVNEGETAEYKPGYQAQPADRPAFEIKPVYGAGDGYRQDYKLPPYGRSGREPLSNGLKVFLTILFTVIPGIGQLAGIITAIVFMNAEDDADRKSFGVALLVASIILFVLSCIGCFVLTLFFSINQSSVFYGN